MSQKKDAIGRVLPVNAGPVKDIRQLRDEIYAVTGVPRPIEFTDKVVGLIEYRDGSIIDVVRQVCP